MAAAETDETSFPSFTGVSLAGVTLSSVLDSQLPSPVVFLPKLKASDEEDLVVLDSCLVRTDKEFSSDFHLAIDQAFRPVPSSEDAVAWALEGSGYGFLVFRYKSVPSEGKRVCQFLIVQSARRKKWTLVKGTYSRGESRLGFETAQREFCEESGLDWAESVLYADFTVGSSVRGERTKEEKKKEGAGVASDKEVSVPELLTAQRWSEMDKSTFPTHRRIKWNQAWVVQLREDTPDDPQVTPLMRHELSQIKWVRYEEMTKELYSHKSISFQTLVDPIIEQFDIKLSVDLTVTDEQMLRDRYGISLASDPAKPPVLAPKLIPGAEESDLSMLAELKKVLSDSAVDLKLPVNNANFIPVAALTAGVDALSGLTLAKLQEMCAPDSKFNPDRQLTMRLLSDGITEEEWVIRCNFGHSYRFLNYAQCCGGRIFNLQDFLAL